MARRPKETTESLRPVSAVTGPVDGFRGTQVCAIVGITYRQLDYWARTNLLRPTLVDATGSGSQRRYSYGDVLELKVIKRLLDAGLKLQQARQAVECLRGDLGVDLASAQLVLADNELEDKIVVPVRQTVLCTQSDPGEKHRRRRSVSGDTVMSTRRKTIRLASPYR